MIEKKAWKICYLSGPHFIIKLVLGTSPKAPLFNVREQFFLKQGDVFNQGISSPGVWGKCYFTRYNPTYCKSHNILSSVRIAAVLDAIYGVLLEKDQRSIRK